MAMVSRRKRIGDHSLQSISELLGETLMSRGMGNIADLVMLSSCWESLVGDRISRNASPTHLARGVLTLQVTSSTWQNELTFMQQTLVDKINNALGKHAVTKIRAVPGNPVLNPVLNHTHTHTRIPTPNNPSADYPAATSTVQPHLQQPQPQPPQRQRQNTSDADAALQHNSTLFDNLNAAIKRAYTAAQS